MYVLRGREWMTHYHGLENQALVMSSHESKMAGIYSTRNVCVYYNTLYSRGIGCALSC